MNRHRIEAYILDSKGRVAASFERLHWDEQEVVDRAIEVLGEQDNGTRVTTPVLGTLASVAVAFLPKCPLCWAAYLSMLGVTGLSLPYSPWLQPILVLLMLANIVSVWLRGRATARMTGPYLVTAGALAILASKVDSGSPKLAVLGIVLTLLGSLLSVARSLGSRKYQSSAEKKSLSLFFSREKI